MDFVIPQPGQGKPVSIFNGQNDCAWSRWPSWLPSIKKNGNASVKTRPAIPYNFLCNEVLLVKLVDITLYNHGRNHWE